MTAQKAMEYIMEDAERMARLNYEVTHRTYDASQAYHECRSAITALLYVGLLTDEEYSDYSDQITKRTMEINTAAWAIEQNKRIAAEETEKEGVA